VHTRTSTTHYQEPGVSPVCLNIVGVNDALSATGSTRAGTPCKRGTLLPSYVCAICASYTHDIGASYACVISASYTDHSSGVSCSDSPSTNASCRTTISREELRGTLIGSLALVADSAVRFWCEGFTRRAANIRTSGVIEVQLLPPRNHLLSSGTKIGEIEAA
jgi:hypothetical protein